MSDAVPSNGVTANSTESNVYPPVFVPVVNPWAEDWVVLTFAAPVAAVWPILLTSGGGATVELLVTAGTSSLPVAKEAASLPASSWRAVGVVAARGVGVGDGDGLALVDHGG